MLKKLVLILVVVLIVGAYVGWKSHKKSRRSGEIRAQATEFAQGVELPRDDPTYRESASADPQEPPDKEGSPNVSSTQKSVLTLATLGHVDHGKTTLAAAMAARSAAKYGTLAKSYTEIAKGRTVLSDDKTVTIAASRVEYESAKRRYLQIDYPGHGDIIKSLIVGAPPIDGAILVVSAADGPMPQTREQVLLARQVNVPFIVVFLSKVDLVDDPNLIELVEVEIRDLLNNYQFPGDDTPIIHGNAKACIEKGPADDRVNACIDELVEALDAYIPTPQPQVVAAPDSITPHTKFECEVYVLSKEEGGRQKPFFKGYRPQFTFRTTDVTGEAQRLTSMDGHEAEMCMPGDNIRMEVKLITPVAMEPQLRFSIREGGRTVGAGVVTKIID